MNGTLEDRFGGKQPGDAQAESLDESRLGPPLDGEDDSLEDLQTEIRLFYDGDRTKYAFVLMEGAEVPVDGNARELIESEGLGAYLTAQIELINSLADERGNGFLMVARQLGRLRELDSRERKTPPYGTAMTQVRYDSGGHR